MITVSEAWKKTQEQLLLPESFLEISVCINDTNASSQGVLSVTSEADFSNKNKITGNIGTPPAANYATLEHNLWVLNGSKNIMPDNGPFDTPGYVSQDDTLPTITLTLPEMRTTTIPGFTIFWSSEYNDYATDFTIQVKRGGSVIASTTVTGNKTNHSLVNLEASNYDSVVITVSKWSLPGRRVRIDSLILGYILTFGKNEIMDYTHEQTGDLLSGELPKNHIEFTLDNSDGRWNPSNPTGLQQYLSERQEVIVRYGMNVNGATEWIKAGTFYMSEWRAPANGLEAHFVARDIFEFMLNVPYDEPGFVTTLNEDTVVYGEESDIAHGENVILSLSKGTIVTVYEEGYFGYRIEQGWIEQSVDTTNYPTFGDQVRKALSLVNLPKNFSVSIDSSLYDNWVVLGAVKGSVAEMLQICANANGCLMWQDRDGVLNIKPMSAMDSGYAIPQRLSYSHPEVELAKPLKGVTVNYVFGEQYYRPHGDSGEDITIDNPMIVEPLKIGEWAEGVSKHRKSVTGEFRADPRLDVFDTVSVESKYGTIEKVMLTNVKYSYTGSFKASYTGRVMSD